MCRPLSSISLSLSVSLPPLSPSIYLSPSHSPSHSPSSSPYPSHSPCITISSSRSSSLHSSAFSSDLLLHPYSLSLPSFLTAGLMCSVLDIEACCQIRYRRAYIGSSGPRRLTHRFAVHRCSTLQQCLSPWSLRTTSVAAPTLPNILRQCDCGSYDIKTIN